MKFELKDYQDEAAAKVLSGLRKGSAEYDADREHTAVSLSAPTGAGKTVIAASVIERMLFGDPDGEFGGDPNSIFVWLTDDPSLNEQTRKKILEASDRLQPGQLITLDDSFDQATFDGGRVYFLNIQKLGKKSNLVVKKEGRRVNVLWDTINNTIRSSGANYYLVIDEAHRGTGRRSSEDQTITQRLLNGDRLVTAAPVVLGISATPKRFEDAIASGSQSRVPRKVSVPVSAVRESGLIKDVLSISYRAESQLMETTLVRQAVASLRAVDLAWNKYTDSEGEPPVKPVLVLQIGPNANPVEVGALIDVCVGEWDVLGTRNAIAHSLESHTAIEFGGHSVNYVQPQNIQDHPSIRMVIFKEALTTGWDCPRAEVMVSLRTARDDTYIAQLIGRMVRSPLARRIESDETLNRVSLFLPNFDKEAVASVKQKLESDEGGLPTDIEINSVDAQRNKKVDAACFGVVEQLPSYVVPGPIHRSQVTRLHKLAALLIGDGLLPNAIQVADDFLVSVLDSERSRLEADGTLETRIADAQTVKVETMNIAEEGKYTLTGTSYKTDAADLNRLFNGAKRKLRDGLAEKYWGHRVMNNNDEPSDAKVLAIALASDTDTVDKVETEAAGRVRQWLDTYGDAISRLSEDKKARYANVRAMARKPEATKPGLPTGPIAMPGDTEVQAFEKHLYSDSSGNFRARLGSWESHVIELESSRPNFEAWYRNPAGGQRSLRIPFDTGSGFAKFYPDFVVLHRSDDGEIVASIVDPHGHHLADAPDKLKGLATYAAENGDSFARIIGVIKNASGDFRMLDLKDPTVQESVRAVSSKEDIENIYSRLGAAYS